MWNVYVKFKDVAGKDGSERLMGLEWRMVGAMFAGVGMMRFMVACFDGAAIGAYPESPVWFVDRTQLGVTSVACAHSAAGKLN